MVFNIRPTKMAITLITIANKPTYKKLFKLPSVFSVIIEPAIKEDKANANSFIEERTLIKLPLFSAFTTEVIKVVAGTFLPLETTK